MSSQNGMSVCMNVGELREECQVALDRVDADTAVDQRSETECRSVSADATARRRSVSAEATARRTQGEGEIPPLGPACSKARHIARTRNASATPGTSLTSKAAADRMASRKSQRQAALDYNRFAALATAEQEDGDQPPICIDSDEAEDADHAERGKPPLKRRMTKEDGEEEPSSSEETREKKRGRPRTTGLYVGRGDAIERANKLRRESLELEAEKSMRSLKQRQVLANHRASVEDKLDELGNAPNEDLSNRVRESMAHVWKLAVSSKNLKGGYVKELKQAAAVSAASMEILSARMESSDPEGDALKQIKALRKALEQTKREAIAAKEEAEKAKQEMEKLRKELAEIKESGRPRRRVRAVREDSPPPHHLQRWKWRWTTPLWAQRQRT